MEIKKELEIDFGEVGSEFDLNNPQPVEKLMHSALTEANELPTRGKIYKDKGVPQFITLRSMNTTDDLKRCGSAKLQYKGVASMIDDCIEDPMTLSVYDMALGDYEFLLHKLRVVTYGPEYKMNVYCPSCKKVVETIADLDQEYVEEFDMQVFNERQLITLPKAQSVIKLRYQTPRMLDSIQVKARELNTRYKDNGLEYTLLVTIMYLIEEVDGKRLDYQALMQFVNHLDAYDMMYLINHADLLNESIGFNTELVVDCPECGGLIETVFREGPEFFRPTTVR